MSSNQQGPIGAIEQNAAQAATDPEAPGETRVEGAHRALHDMVARGGSFSGRERNCAFLNTRDGAFADVSSAVGFDFSDDARAVLTLDYDGDGDVDVVTTNRTAPRLRILLNRSERIRGGDETRGTTFVLQGARGNMDGVGATLILKPEHGPPIIRSVSAGSAFLGQSSPRLTVGAGTNARFTDVSVQWSGGERESFGALEAGRRWCLHEGTGDAQSLLPVQPIALPVSSDASLEPSIEGPSCGASTHARLTVPEPLPPMERNGAPNAWRTIDGELCSLPAAGAPSVITLWSTACPLCAAELRDWALSPASHSILALSVDAVVAAAQGDEFDAASYEEKVDAFGSARVLEVTFGLATHDLIDALQSAIDRPFARDEDLALPVTFVLDADGSIAALHRGRVSQTVIASDLAFLESERAPDAGARRDRSTPFVGRWASEPPTVSAIALARTWIESGRSAAGGDLLLRAHQRGSIAAEQAASRPASRAAAEAARILHANGDIERALALSNMVSELRPDWPKGHFNRAVMLDAAGRSEDAEAAYTRALALRPRYWQALANRGLLHANSGRTQRGVADLEAALEALPKAATPEQRGQLRAMLDSLR